MHVDMSGAGKMAEGPEGIQTEDEGRSPQSPW